MKLNVKQLSIPLLGALKSHKRLPQIKQLHALITTSHLLQDPFYATNLVRFYALNHDLPSARHVFDQSPQRSVFLWNSIIRACAQSHRFADAFSLFSKMLRSETRPDRFTYACLVRASHEKFDLDSLRIVHCGLVVSGFGWDSVCCSALVTGYSKMGFVSEATRVFYGVLEPDLVLWNTVISGCVSCGFWSKGLELFNRMCGNGRLRPDGYSVVGLISGLVDPILLGSGLSLHGLCLKSAFEGSAHVGCAILRMYSRFGYMNSAYRVFRSLSQPDLVTWSALITGYSQSRDYEKALLLFWDLNMGGNKGDPVLIASVLTAAAQSANVRPGSEIHGFVLRNGFEKEVTVSSALIDMYSKCGFVWLGMRVFENLPNRNIVTYNAVISGLGLHGLASQAFRIFEEILENGMKPDESTFSALLCACCHSGLVNCGREIFRRMIVEFGIQARTEHYVYMVKLLGMAGELEEAYNFILSLMPPIDSSIWGALLSCCDTWGNSKLAEVVAQQLFNNKPTEARYVVMLSNIYAGDSRWYDVNEVRDDMAIAGTCKMPGYSWATGI